MHLLGCLYRMCLFLCMSTELIHQNRERESKEVIENKAIRSIFILRRGEGTKHLEKFSHFSFLMQTNHINRWKMWHMWWRWQVWEPGVDGPKVFRVRDWNHKTFLRIWTNINFLFFCKRSCNNHVNTRHQYTQSVLNIGNRK